MEAGLQARHTPNKSILHIIQSYGGTVHTKLVHSLKKYGTCLNSVTRINLQCIVQVIRKVVQTLLILILSYTSQEHNASFLVAFYTPSTATFKSFTKPEKSFSRLSKTPAKKDSSEHLTSKIMEHN